MRHPVSASLSGSIQATYNRFVLTIARIPLSRIEQSVIEGTSGMISVRDLVAYQIGWGTQLIEWYTKGVAGEMPHMPVEGFIKWDYVAIARHFYTRHRYATLTEQLQKLQETAEAIISITEKEFANGTLDKTGIWPWCTLRSGADWPLSKWIQVNTVAPWKRAIQLLRKIS